MYTKVATKQQQYTTKNIHGRNHKQTAYILPAIKSSFIECRVDFFYEKDGK